jgi:hypothetical protein
VDAVEVSLAPGVSSVHVIPARVERREVHCGLGGSPYAVIEALPCDVDGIMSTQQGTAGDARKALFIAAVQERYDIASEVEAWRRIAQLAGELLAKTDEVDAATSLTLLVGTGLAAYP